MAQNGRTIDKDLGRIRILEDMDEISNSHVSIGIHENEKPYPEGQAVVDVAVYNEFGTPKIPERSYLRSTFDEKRQEWRRKTNDGMREIVLGKKTVKVFLSALGFEMASEVQNKILTMRSPSNAASTIKQKPNIGDNPLIETYHLYNSTGFQVSKRKGAEKLTPVIHPNKK